MGLRPDHRPERPLGRVGGGGVAAAGAAVLGVRWGVCAVDVAWDAQDVRAFHSGAGGWERGEIGVDEGEVGGVELLVRLRTSSMVPQSCRERQIPMPVDFPRINAYNYVVHARSIP